MSLRPFSLLLLAAGLALAAACSGDATDEAPADAGTDSGADSEGGTDAAPDTTGDGSEDAAAEDVAADGAADVAIDAAPDAAVDAQDEDVPMGVCGPVAPRRAFVVSELRFARESPSGVSNGFDIDERVSNGADAQGCRKPDMTTPEGLQGVDNQFAKLLPAIEAAGGQALEGLIQIAINEGDILIMLELESFDDPGEDACVVATLSRGSGLPMLDANGRLEGGQTFDRDATIAPSTARGAITEGALEFGPVEFVVPAYVFYYEFLFPIEQGRVRVNFRDDGTAYGVMGGGISLDYLIETASGITGAGGAPDALIALAPGLADLFPDETGQCQAVSAVLEFEAVPAYFYED